jgi:uncharacterized membrane protein YfcA
LLLGVCGIAGSIPGSLLSPYFSSATLLLLFSGIMIIASISMLRSRGSDAFVGLATRFATASIEWDVVAAFLAGGLAGNIVASTFVHNLDQRSLKRIFAVFILIVGLFTAASATGVIPIRFK